MMTRDDRDRETMLREVLFSALDASKSAWALDSPILLYLANMMVQRARADLYQLRAHSRVDQADDTALPDDRRSL